LKHFASPKFWDCYHNLPEGTQKLGEKNFELLKINPKHPSLHFKKIGDLWSVRIGSQHRALGIQVEGGIDWIWIGTHADYEKTIA